MFVSYPQNLQNLGQFFADFSLDSSGYAFWSQVGLREFRIAAAMTHDSTQEFVRQVA